MIKPTMVIALALVAVLSTVAIVLLLPGGERSQANDVKPPTAKPTAEPTPDARRMRLARAGMRAIEEYNTTPPVTTTVAGIIACDYVEAGQGGCVVTITDGQNLGCAIIVFSVPKGRFLGQQEADPQACLDPNVS